MAVDDRAEAPALWLRLVQAQAVALPLVHKILRRRHGLSLTELGVLQALATASTRQTMTDLQRCTHLSAAGTTRVAGGLERRGLLLRTREDGDRRLLYVELTAEGASVCVAAAATADAAVLDLVGAVGEQDIVAATRVLAALAGPPTVTTLREQATTRPTARVRRV